MRPMIENFNLLAKLEVLATYVNTILGASSRIYQHAFNPNTNYFFIGSYKNNMRLFQNYMKIIKLSKCCVNFTTNSLIYLK